MAKSWKTLLKTTDSDSQNDIGNESSLNNFQLTLDDIASQNDELNNLLKERQSLENGMDSLLQSSNPLNDQRFAGGIDSFKNKREKEKNRTAQKKKLEERILRKSKELEKWKEKQDRLKEKLVLQKKLLQRKETDQGPSTSRKAPKSTEKSSGKIRLNTDALRKQKDVIERKKKGLDEGIRKVKKVTDTIKTVKKTLDTDALRDLAKFQKRSGPDNPEKKKKIPLEIPVRIQTIKDDWDEKRESKQEALKEKISLKRLSDKLQEMKRFAPIEKLDEKIPGELPKLKDLTDDLKKESSFEDRLNKAVDKLSSKKNEQKEEEQKEADRREKQKEEVLLKRRAERKEEERSTRKKERKKEKYA